MLQYYHEGVGSWGWFFPFHYAPLASDLVDLPRHVVRGETTGEGSAPLGRPFVCRRPLDSLLAFPSAITPSPPHPATHTA